MMQDKCTLSHKQETEKNVNVQTVKNTGRRIALEQTQKLHRQPRGWDKVVSVVLQIGVR